jgi:hypothetical protein
VRIVFPLVEVTLSKPSGFRNVHLKHRVMVRAGVGKLMLQSGRQPLDLRNRMAYKLDTENLFSNPRVFHATFIARVAWVKMKKSSPQAASSGTVSRG